MILLPACSTLFPTRRSSDLLMADGLARLMAPILSFTGDEVWRFLPGAREESVHIAVFPRAGERSEEHTSELQSRFDLVCRLLLEKKKNKPHTSVDVMTRGAQ